MKPKFKFLVGDINWRDYGGKWISQKFNNGDFDYWYVIDFINMDDACGRDNEGMPKYNVSLSVVAPSEVPDEEMASAMESCGCLNVEYTDEMKVEVLHSYGISAVVKNWNGNNAYSLIKSAKGEAYINASFTFGFSMDAAKNRIGTTGWEFLKGDITAGLNRTIASGSTEGKILGKMYAIEPKPEADASVN